MREPPPPPRTMDLLPRDRRGLPVPFVAAWSSETWAIGRDPLVPHPVAILTRGRPGHGRPVFGVLNEPRQRRCVLLRLCQVCSAPLAEAGWLPDTSIDGHLKDGRPVATEPLCCEPCVRWAAQACPGLRPPNALLRVTAVTPVLQLVDPSRAPAAHWRRFGPDDPTLRARLGVVARRDGGVVGYVKGALDTYEAIPLEAARK